MFLEEFNVVSVFSNVELSSERYSLFLIESHSKPTLVSAQISVPMFCTGLRL